MGNDATIAERVIRQRAGAAHLLAILLVVTQGARMGGGESLLSWAIWAAAVLAFALWGSGVMQGKTVRLLVNDESSAENRRHALVCGFWVALASAAICFALTFVKSYGPRDAIQVIVTSGVAAALLHFGAMERRALSN